jgi:hypothetical protein
MGELFQPLKLSLVEGSGVLEVFQVAMVCDDPYGLLRSFEPGSPELKSLEDW